MSIPRLEFKRDHFRDFQYLLEREWLVTNGLGGFASSTLMQIATRRYHGIFIANIDQGRTVLLPRLDEIIDIPDEENIYLSGTQYTSGAFIGDTHKYLQDFYLWAHKPVWVYNIKNTVLKRTIFMPYGFNTLIIEYENCCCGPGIDMILRPYISYRLMEDFLGRSGHWPIELKEYPCHLDIAAFKGAEVMHVAIRGTEGETNIDEYISYNNFFNVEKERGHDHEESFKSPVWFKVKIEPSKKIYFVCSLEENFNQIDCQHLLSGEMDRVRKIISFLPEKERKDLGGLLALSTDQFIIYPGARVHKDSSGNVLEADTHSIIAGYHWFSDWGRDTMISLEGLTLNTKRFKEAKLILLTFSKYVKDGLIPNLFPEGEKEGLYHTVDATLWFFHAIDRYYSVTKDMETLILLYPVLESIIDFHLRGTHFGIRSDEIDGMIKAGEEGYQLTWMDAKVGNWVVTPRRGKPVEIQALWYNALKLMSLWAQSFQKNSEKYSFIADKVFESFNKRFWYEKGGYLYDVIDGENGDDMSLRPNQIFSFSLRFPVLKNDRWEAVLKTVEGELLTPYGLRTLSRSHENYKSRYSGDRLARDAAYHQGMVWPWLLGAYVNCLIKVKGKKALNESVLEPFYDNLYDAGIGSISEIFDAEAPYLSKGCIAQAWSVAEIFRIWCLVKQL